MKSIRILLTQLIYGWLLLFMTGAISLTAADDEGNVSHMTAMARSSMEWQPNGQPARLDFNFGDFKGWLRSGGEWGIEGMVVHNRLGCATYQLGMRFGHGNPACTDVQWLTPVQYATSVRQCNSAPVKHSGGEINPDIAPQFAKVTCGEGLLKCTGACD